MLARLAGELPLDGFRYEPKWDGFRCVVARDREGVRMVSRHGRPFTRYFPELVDAFAALRDDDVTLDGEIMIETEHGFDFAALLSRLHPAESPVRRLSVEIPARFVAFDLIWRGGDLRDTPFRDRRAALVDVTAGGPPHVTAGAPPRIAATPETVDVALATEWLTAGDGAGIDGVLAKDPDATYQPGKRVMIKVKTRRTLDAVVAGYRWMMDRDAIGSLLLGLYDDAGSLRHIGVASSFS